MSLPDFPSLTVAQIKAYVDAQSLHNEGLLQTLEQDPRAGVRALASRARSKQRAESKEQARLEKMLTLEKKLRMRGFVHIAGVDEAGRGPLAGPVVAAAVILPPDVVITGLNDSKAISEQRRESLFEEIKQTALAYGIAQASPEEIDRINIRNATHLAMRRALEGLPIPPDRVLVDGNAVPESPFQEQAIIGGDGASLSIAAASVLAKVTRDRLMVALDKDYPVYGFAKHKGYGSADHLLALKTHGPCPIHRKTFGNVVGAQTQRSDDYDIFAEGIQTAQTPAQLEAIGQSIASTKGLLPQDELDALRQLYQKRRQSLTRTGETGERLAAQFLQKAGYTLLETQFRAVGGEIDIIARTQGHLVFVEVKTATTDHFGPPESWVTPQKQVQISRVAQAYLQKNPHPQLSSRFDVVGILNTDGPPTINHIKNAFTLSG